MKIRMCSVEHCSAPIVEVKNDNGCSYYVCHEGGIIFYSHSDIELINKEIDSYLNTFDFEKADEQQYLMSGDNFSFETAIRNLKDDHKHIRELSNSERLLGKLLYAIFTVKERFDNLQNNS